MNLDVVFDCGSIIQEVLIEVNLVLKDVENFMAIDTQKHIIKHRTDVDEKLGVQDVIDISNDLVQILEDIYTVLNTFKLLFILIKIHDSIKTHDLVLILHYMSNTIY